MTSDEQSPAEKAGFRAERPWDYNRKYTLGLRIDHLAMRAGSSREATGAIGWAVLDTAQFSKGELVLPPDATDEQAATEAVLFYEKLQAEYGPHPVELWQYTKAGFKRSQAFRDGMSHEAHTQRFHATRTALRAAGITVRTRLAK